MFIPIHPKRLDAAKNWLYDHKLYAIILSLFVLLFIFLPQWGSAVWQLFTDKPFFVWLSERTKTMQFSAYWITVPIGSLAFLFIVYLLLTGRHRIQTEELPAGETTAEAIAIAPCPDKWLHAIAEGDKRNINRQVHIVFLKVDYAGLAEITQYVEIIFKVINASVYHITIDKQIQDGAVYLNNTKLNPKQTEILGSLENIARGEQEKRLLVIQQWLTPAEAERISKPLSDDKFNLSRLSLRVSGGYDGADVKSQRLFLPSSVPIHREIGI